MTETNFQYAGPFRRSAAAAIDMFIANFIRAFVISILGNLWLKNSFQQFWIDFRAKFETDFIGQDPERIAFLTNHIVFKEVLLVLFLTFASGAFYYILCSNSKWQGGVGKKLMKIKLIKQQDGLALNFIENVKYYLLSIVPWFFVFYIFSFQMINGVGLYQAITGNLFNLIFGLIILAWLQAHLITKKKTTATDMICKTVVVRMPAEPK
jgi:uncharacterized RDD family membrane protein YckC